MEADEAQTQASKFSNGKLDLSNPTSTTAIGGNSNSNSSNNLGMGEIGGGGNGLREWQHSSRIIRVSRASGGKDRHSKVWTAKGARDRRVRLSVATAIQFYDLQDRLGFDQPSKAVEWLIKAASDAISELPSLNSSSFPETPRQQSPAAAFIGGKDEKGFDSSAELETEIDRDPGNFVQTQTQHGPNPSKSSACSSPSETSKGSGSFNRTEIRVKARERAKEKDNNQTDQSTTQQQQSSSSFTQLLTSGIGDMNIPGVSSSPPPPMNYFTNTGLMGGGGSSSTRGQIIQLGSSNMHQGMMTVSPFCTIGGDQHQHHQHPQQELQHFPFVHDHHLPPGSGNDQYNLSFSISPSSAVNPAAAAYNNNNRGTLQSNSLPSLLPHLQRYSSSPLDVSTLPFFLGVAVENQHHHHNAAQFPPPGLQLSYGDNGGAGQSDQNGKG